MAGFPGRQGLYPATECVKISGTFGTHIQTSVHTLVAFDCMTMPGTDVMMLKKFLPKNLAKILAFLTQKKASFCKKCDHNIGF
jgi:hypothetical protein